MVVGDLLLPSTPSASSRAACRDIAQTLSEWQGPGIVVVCGQLVATGCPGAPGPAEVLSLHRDLTAAFTSFAARPETQIMAVLPEAAEHGELVDALTELGVVVHPAVDFQCVTGVGIRKVLVRAGTQRPDLAQPVDVAPDDERPWLVGMERLDDPRQARRFVTSRLLYRRLRRYLWVPPLVLAAIALLLRLELVRDGLGHVFRSPRQQRALEHAYAAGLVLPFPGHRPHRRRVVGGVGRDRGPHLPWYLARASVAGISARPGRRAAGAPRGPSPRHPP